MRTRLLAAFLAIAFAILVMQDLPLASYLQNVERDRVTVSLERDAWTLGDSAESIVVTNDLAGLTSLAQDYALRSGSRVDIVDATGTVLATTQPGELGYDYSNRIEITTALGGSANFGERDSAAIGGRMLYVVVPIRSGTSVIGALRITYPVSSVDAIVQRRTRSIYIAGLVTLLVAITTAFMLSGAYTRRLRRIHSATEQLAGGDLATRIPSTDAGAEELVAIEQSFNQMAARLQTLVESQRAFASDASHQLRTPLTALRLRLENAADSLHDSAATQQSLDQAVVEVQRLQVLVDGLLALARLEGRAAHVVAADVDPLIAERLELWGPLAEERGVVLQCAVPSGLLVSCVPGALEQVLDSYLDNALEFAPSGTTVRIEALAHEHTVDFHIIDEGPGMDELARSRAFDRFWRGRADDSGTGLGLAIAARLAEVSGGSVRLEASAPHGIDAVFTLRRA